MAAEIATINMPTNAVLAPMVRVSVIKGAYVQHPHPNASNFASIVGIMPKGKQPSETTPVLVDGDTITLLDPLNFYMTPLYNQYYAELDNNGAYVRTFPIQGDSRPPASAREVIDAVIIVRMADKTLKPARIRLKTGKCGLMKDAYDALAAMDRTDKMFAPLIKAGLEPFYFQHFTPVYGSGVGKQSKKAYVTVSAKGANTTLDEAKALLATFKNPEFVEDINICIEGHGDSVATVSQMM